MVCVLPLPVWPYAKMVPLNPSNALSTRGAATSWKMAACSVVGPYTKSKAKSLSLSLPLYPSFSSSLSLSSSVLSLSLFLSIPLFLCSLALSLSLCPSPCPSLGSKRYTNGICNLFATTGGPDHDNPADNKHKSCLQCKWGAFYETTSIKQTYTDTR